MVSDVAVHKPRSWIIGLESDDHVSIGRKQNDIAPWRVVEGQVQTTRECAISDLLEDSKVVTVYFPPLAREMCLHGPRREDTNASE